MLPENKKPLKMAEFKSDFCKSILIISAFSMIDRSFALGIRIGVGITFLNILARKLIKKPPHNNKRYTHNIISRPTSVMLWGPIREEVLHRFVMLRILKYSAGLALPSIVSEPISNIHLSCVDIFAIIGSAVNFGLEHFKNFKAKDNYEQVISCVIVGLLYGALSLYFEPQATIAAHIANNSLGMCFIFLLTLFMEPMLSRLNERLAMLDEQKDKGQRIFIQRQIEALNDIKSFFNKEDCLPKITNNANVLFAQEKSASNPPRLTLQS